MFENLTVDEATELTRMLSDGYARSREYGRDCTDIARRAYSDQTARYLMAKASAQAAMRQEITSIRWQIKVDMLQSW